jgi:SAM-dependent methyltransferase
LVRSDVGAAARWLYRMMGVADPAHYLHARYCVRALARIVRVGTEPQRILDAGCGRGDYAIYLARRYPAARVLGVDLDATLIARNRDVAARLGVRNVEFAVVDLQAFHPAAEFDLIVSIDVLEHLPQQERALANLAGALRPEGIAFYHIPTVRERPVPFSRYLTGFHAWAEDEHTAPDRTAGEFAELVRASGLELVELRRTFGRWTGELATSLFQLPFADTAGNRILQALLAPACRVLVLLDAVPQRTRYAVAVTARRPAPARPGTGPRTGAP